MYLEKRRRKWYALQEIPPNLREAMGGKKRLVVSLKTEDEQEAKRRAALCEVRWHRELAKAKNSNIDPLEQEREYWRQAFDACSSDFEREILSSILQDKLDNQLERAARQQGYTGNDLSDLPEADEAIRTYKIATGKITKTDSYIDDWLATKDNIQPKTERMYRSDLERLARKFAYLQDINKADVTSWIAKDLLQQEGMNRKTLDRLLPAYRGYWKYLQDIGKVPDDVEPFTKLSVQQNGSKSVRPRDKRKDYTPDEVFQLLEAASPKDTPLADLIRLGMWTGARISELCGLKVEQVHLDAPFPFFRIEDSKTAAGIRTVPVHPELKETLERLTKSSDDGYVLSGLTPDKYGDRSNAIGKRFGRLKKKLGFTSQHGFHSFRHTVITRLLNADVQQSVVASIVGHDSADSVTLGVYHKGFNLERQTHAIMALDYPRPSTSS
ncbi:tyrosine-type recombinase/integrase [Thiorhodococcus fuscus]|uniref:Tyrosine-type recombinase/integrase n=1 Tax=Thiorhodococcus fuscus TaxID=527200 RepID=A0ABW4Y8I0_9GAMM